jgi:uncharacterized protein (TIGR02444 family)
MNERMGSTNAELWRFATAYYAQPGIATALLTLQDREGLDVVVILFGLWHGMSGRGRLDQRQLAAADRAVGAIRRAVIEPLRALRRRLKSIPDPDIRRLREGVQALELEAEKAALHRLAAIAALPDAGLDRAARLDAAHANLALCLGAAAGCAEAPILRDGLATFSAAPDHLELLTHPRGRARPTA